MPTKSALAISICCAILTLGVIVVLFYSPPQPLAVGQPEIIGTVYSVIDGDTIKIQVTEIRQPKADIVVGTVETIRLAGIDGPEFGEPGYEETIQFVKSRCPVGTTVGLNVDDLARDGYGYGRGKYGRVIAVIYVDGSNLNAEILQWGHPKGYITITHYTSEFNPYDWL